MHVFAIAAITADGFIARDKNHRVTWTSKQDKTWFNQRTQKAGVCIMGGHTYRTINQPLPNRLNIVYTQNPKSISPAKNLRLTKDSPKVLLKKLSQEGFQEVAVCGGGQIYTLFLKAKLIDTFYITIEPVLFGQGVSLFTKPLDINFRLKSQTNLTPHTLLLEYSVKK